MAFLTFSPNFQIFISHYSFSFEKLFKKITYLKKNLQNYHNLKVKSITEGKNLQICMRCHGCAKRIAKILFFILVD